MEKGKLIYTITIKIECGHFERARYYIDRFMDDFPDYILGLVNSNEKVEIKVDKSAKKI